jgi:hypothetical protein
VPGNRNNPLIILNIKEKMCNNEECKCENCTCDPCGCTIDNQCGCDEEVVAPI